MLPNEARTIFSSRTEWFGDGPEVWNVENSETPAGVPIRIYRTTDARKLPAIVYFHGGGWVFGDLDSHDALCRHLAKETEFCVVSVDYRRAPEFQFPIALDDCYETVRYVTSEFASIGIDPMNILVAGDSAGGNLALTSCLKAKVDDGPKIAGQLLLYPVLNNDFETVSYEKYATGFGLTRETMQWFWDCYLGRSVYRHIRGTSTN